MLPRGRPRLEQGVHGLLSVGVSRVCGFCPQHCCAPASWAFFPAHKYWNLRDPYAKCRKGLRAKSAALCWRTEFIAEWILKGTVCPGTCWSWLLTHWEASISSGAPAGPLAQHRHLSPCCPGSRRTFLLHFFLVVFDLH